MRPFAVLFALWALTLSTACDDPVEVDDAGSDARVDAGPADAGLAPSDAGRVEDLGVVDAGEPDLGFEDAGASDAEPTDAPAPDLGALDTGLPDTGVEPDLGFVDAGVPDSGVEPDLGFVDAGVLDSGVEPDLGFVDAGFPDSGVMPDSGAVDAGAVDAGPVACTVTPNSCPTGEVCLGQSCSCVGELVGQHILRADGTVVYWASGPGLVITTTAGATLDQVLEVTSGSAHGCARRVDRSVWCWPTTFTGNRNGQLGNGVTASSVPSGDYFRATRVLTAPGTPLTGAARIDRGSTRSNAKAASCAILTSGELRCWGAPDSSGGGGGSLFNDGVSGNRPFAVPILAAANTPVTGVTDVSIGARHACLVRTGTTAGQVWCWGSGIGGALGIGSQAGQTYPNRVNLPGPADQLGAGFDATCARIADAVYCWGSSGSGQVGLGSPSANTDGCINFCRLTPARVIDANGPLTGVQDYEMGYLFSCARRTTNELVCWGARTGASRFEVATPVTVGVTPAVDVARFTTFGGSGISSGLHWITRDDMLYRGGQPVSIGCP